MQSPLVKLSCGCVCIPLNQKSEKLANHMNVWLFQACDAETDMILGGIRPISDEKIAKAIPLTPDEFANIQRKVQQQLQAGEAMFSIVNNMERAKDYQKNFYKSPCT